MSKEPEIVAQHKELLLWLRQNLDLKSEMLYTPEAIIQLINYRVSYLLEKQPEQLFSLLYRLDIFESKLKEVLDQSSDVSYHIAQLIYDRQIEKIKSRLYYKHKNKLPKDDELSW